MARRVAVKPSVPASAEKAAEPIPQFDLHAQYASIAAEIQSAIAEVLVSQRFILGPQGAALEKEVAGICGRRFGIGVASGTDALMLSLRVCGVGPGDEVIVPAFSFIATAGAVGAVGARPLFADIDPRSFNIAPPEIERNISPRTRAIIPVHLFGLPAAMDAVRELAERHNLAVIEDNAQAIGARYHGRYTGSLGRLGCVSFYPTKNLGAYGDAGMVVTDSEETAMRLRSLRDHGQIGKYVSSERGWNSRLDEIQAAVLRVKLRHLVRWNSARQAHARHYDELLARIPGIVTPQVPAGSEHSYHQYTIRVQDRDRIQRALAEGGISTAVYYPVPPPLQPLYSGSGSKPGDFPVAEQAAAEVLSLPMYPELRSDQIERIASALAAVLAP